MYYFIFTKKENEPKRWPSLYREDENSVYASPSRSKIRLHYEWQYMIDGEDDEEEEVVMDRWTLLRAKLKLARLMRE